MTMPMQTRLRIDFKISEVSCNPNDPPPPGARYVTFGDFVDAHKIKEFFGRCGVACDTMFQGMYSPVVMRLTSPTVDRKIEFIKLVREWTSLGLKEAKDCIEQPAGSALILFKDVQHAKTCLTSLRLRDIMNVELDACSYEEMLNKGVPEARLNALK